MKKAVNFLIFVPMLLFSLFFYNNNVFYNKFKEYNNATFCYVYSNKNFTNKTENLNTVFTNFKTINNGDKTFLYFSKMKTKIFETPDYMQVCFLGSHNQVQEIIKDLNLNKVFSEKFENYFSFYGYSSNWVKYKILKNKKVNFQIVFKENKITIGYPMIYGSF